MDEVTKTQILEAYSDGDFVNKARIITFGNIRAEYDKNTKIITCYNGPNVIGKIDVSDKGGRRRRRRRTRRSRGSKKRSSRRSRSHKRSRRHH